MYHLHTLHHFCSLTIFTLRDKVRLEPLKLYLWRADLAEWLIALEIRLLDWCCNASNVCVRIPSSESKTCQLKGILFDKSGTKKERRDCDYNTQYGICLLNMSSFYQIGWTTKIPHCRNNSKIKYQDRRKMQNLYP